MEHGAAVFFPKGRRRNDAPLWFEEGSEFLSRLAAKLGDLPHRMTPLLWSGANSVFARDAAARDLAEHLSAEHARHPQAAQLVVAHSHGGNVAIRSLHHLMERDAPASAHMPGVNPFIVTLATPFIEIHRADYGDRTNNIRKAAIAGLWLLLMTTSMAATLFFLSLWKSKSGISDGLELAFILAPLALITAGMLLVRRWVLRRGGHWQKQIDKLNEVTRLDAVRGQRLLVIRAIDDEASLVMALGAILNYRITKFISYAYLIFFTGSGLLVASKFWAPLSALARILGIPLPEDFMLWAYLIIMAVFALSVPIFLGVLMIVRVVHGRELALSPMECQINTQSVPDAADLSKVVTLVNRHNAKSLRHGIYGHEDCARTIADWIRGRLNATRPVPPLAS